MSLLGEQWEILAKPGELYEATGDKQKSHQAFERSAEILQALAARIDDEGLRATFLAGQ